VADTIPMSTQQHLARIGAGAAIGGAVLLFIATLLHPMSADPNDPAAAFAEYAADRLWVASHLGQFLGVAILGVALVALAATIEAGRAAAWARIGIVGTAASVAAAAALQAVDGVALKVMVDRWAHASSEARAAAFEGAFAVRQIEVGLASLLSVLFGLTLSAFGVSLVSSRRFPTWLGWLGLLGGLGTVAAGIAQAYTGFSGLAMALSMPASCVLLAWAIVVGVFLWRLAPGLSTR
jgi:hypothetical protein